MMDDTHYRLYLETGVMTYVVSGQEESRMNPHSTLRALSSQPSTNDTALSNVPCWLAPGIGGCLNHGRLRAMSIMLPALSFVAGTGFIEAGPENLWFVPTPNPGNIRQFYWRPAFAGPCFLAATLLIISVRQNVNFSEQAQVPESVYGRAEVKLCLHLVSPVEPEVSGSLPRFSIHRLPMPNTFSDGGLCLGPEFCGHVEHQILDPWLIFARALQILESAPWGEDLRPTQAAISGCFRWDGVSGKQIASSLMPSAVSEPLSISAVETAIQPLFLEWAALDYSWALVKKQREIVQAVLEPRYQYMAQTEEDTILPCPEAIIDAK